VKNPYEVLGVASTASSNDIKKAYRRLAMKLHPDMNPGDAAGEAKFKDVANAWRLLRDPAKRRRLDAGEIDETGAERPQQRYYRDYAQSPQADAYANDAAFSDFTEGEDPFAELLRRAARGRANRRGADLRFRLPVTLAESIAGAVRRVTLPAGDTLDVTVPAGIVDGQVLRLRGKGTPGSGSGRPGDALVEVEVTADPRFERSGDDLLYEAPISLTEAVEGSRIRIPTPTEDVTLTVPPESSSGTSLRLRGKGAPKRAGGRGDLHVKLRIVLPTPADPALKAFVADWEAGRAFNPREEALK
jgi:DnaJ-class molecular chaperone